MELDESTKIGCYKFTEHWLQLFLIARYQTKLLFDRRSKLGKGLYSSGNLSISTTITISVMTTSSPTLIPKLHAQQMRDHTCTS